MTQPPRLMSDIESKPDLLVPFAPKDEKEFPPLACHEIVTFGALPIDFSRQDSAIGRFTLFGRPQGPADAPVPERAILEPLVAFVEEHRPQLVTWNGHRFDAPLMTMRALKHGLSMPYWFNSRTTRYRYAVDGHLDVKDYLSNFGSSQVGSLDHVARLVGFPGKVGIDGSMVKDMIASGRYADVDRYCLCDVAQTAAIYLRTMLLRGLLGLEDYRRHARDLLSRVDETPGPDLLSPLVRRSDFLLEGARVALSVPDAIFEEVRPS